MYRGAMLDVLCVPDGGNPVKRAPIRDQIGPGRLAGKIAYINDVVETVEEYPKQTQA